MRNGEKIKKQIVAVTLQSAFRSMEGGLRDWQDGTGGHLSISTLSGWLNQKHFPEKKSWKICADYLEQQLSKIEKEEVFETIIEVCGLNVKDDAAKALRYKYDKSFSEFLMYMVYKYKVKTFELVNLQCEILNLILKRKLEEWLENTKGITIETSNVDEKMTVFALRLKKGNQKKIVVLLSYNLRQEENGIIIEKFKKINNIYQDMVCHIALMVDCVQNEEYRTYVREYQTYIVKIENNDITKVDVCKLYLNIAATLASEQLLQYSKTAEMILNKWISKSYLIYKELMCYEYKWEPLRHFFETNSGIGKYPYAMRRAISFEKKQLEKELAMLEKQRGKKIDLLVDLNAVNTSCAVRLYQYASKVLCFDTSERAIDLMQEIINEYNAEKNEMNPGIQNVEFGLLRGEFLEPVEDIDLTGKVDCIVLGLGSFSFIKNTDEVLRKIQRWLKEDGFVFLSAYNANALSVMMNRYVNMNYQYDEKNSRFIFERRTCTWPVPVRMHTFHGMLMMGLRYFSCDSEKSWSYPVLTSVFSDEDSTIGMEIIKEVDKTSALFSHQKLSYGIYNIMKLTPYSKSGNIEYYTKMKQKLQNIGLSYKMIEHAEYYSQESLCQVLKVNGIEVTNNFIKCIMIVEKGEQNTKKYIMILLSLRNRLNMKALKTYYERLGQRFHANKVKFCSGKELADIGLPVGSISPYSYLVLREEREVELLYDSSIIRLPYDILYTYSGNCTGTFEIGKDEFLESLKKMEATPWHLKMDIFGETNKAEDF